VATGKEMASNRLIFMLNFEVELIAVKMRRLFLLFVALGPFCFLHAQVETQTVKTNENTYDDVKLLYRNESTFGLIVHTNGFGFNYRRGWHKTGFSKRVFELEAVSWRHPKEIKVVNPYYDHPKGYYYGKLNSFFIIRPGFGYQNVIYTKPEQNGVEIRYIAFIGVSLGLAKPVYLDILKDSPVSIDDKIIETERYDPDKHFIDNIYGRGPFLRGFGELKIYPGGYAKFGLNFEYGQLDEDVKSLEVGLVADVYPKVIPLMANQHNHQVFLGIYLSFSYGRKWF
jgi:hypothetical protein